MSEQVAQKTTDSRLATRQADQRLYLAAGSIEGEGAKFQCCASRYLSYLKKTKYYLTTYLTTPSPYVNCPETKLF